MMAAVSWQFAQAPTVVSGIIELAGAPWHLSVQRHSPELRQWQARLHQLDDAAEPSGGPGGSASGDFPRLIGGTFFARGRVMNGVPLAGGHRDVEGHDKDQAVGVAEVSILDAEAA